MHWNERWIELKTISGNLARVCILNLLMMAWTCIRSALEIPIKSLISFTAFQIKDCLGFGVQPPPDEETLVSNLSDSSKAPNKESPNALCCCPKVWSCSGINKLVQLLDKVIWWQNAMCWLTWNGEAKLPELLPSNTTPVSALHAHSSGSYLYLNWLCCYHIVLPRPALPLLTLKPNFY